MKRIFRILVIAATTTATITMAVAQHQHDHSAPTTPISAQDTREFVKFPPVMVEHTLTSMRDHLLALQEIQDHLGMGHPEVAANIAETRLGMSSLGLHGAHDVSKFMPQNMQEIGSGMHRAASRFAIVARDSGVTEDLKPALAALANVTAQCVGCHAAYRIK